MILRAELAARSLGYWPPKGHWQHLFIDLIEVSDKLWIQ